MKSIDWTHIAAILAGNGRWLLLCSFLAVLPESSLLANSYTPEKILEHALSQNPDIRAMQSRQESIAQKARSASYWSDPMISVNYFPKPIETRLGAQEANIMLTQGIPWPGKNAAREAELSATANALIHEIEAKRLQITAEIKSLLWSLFAEQKNLLLIQSEQDFLTDLSKVALSKVRVGSGSQQDVTTITLEISLLEERRRLLSEKINSLTTKLATFANLPADIEVVIPAEMPAVSRFSDPDGWKNSLAATTSKHPELQAAEARSMAASSAVTSSKLSATPELRASASWIFINERTAMTPSKDNEDAYSFGLSLSVPLWYGKYTTSNESAFAAKQAAEWDFHKIRLQIENDLADLWQQAVSSQELVSIYSTTIIPQAEQILNSNQSAYQQGGATFDRVISDFRRLLQLRQKKFQEQARLGSLAARIDARLGESAKEIPTTK